MPLCYFVSLSVIVAVVGVFAGTLLNLGVPIPVVILLSFVAGAAIGAAADDHGGLFSALADGADLAHFIGPGQKCGRAWKEVALKVDPQAVAHDRHAEVIDRARQLPDLFL